MVVKFLIALSIGVLALSTAHASIHGVHSKKLRVRLLRLVPTGTKPGAPHAAIASKVQIRPEFLKINPARLVPTGPNPGAPHAAITNEVQIRSKFLKTNPARLVPTGPNPGAPHAAISDNVKIKTYPATLVSTRDAANSDKVQIRSELFKTNPARLVPTGPNPGAPHAAPVQA